jgi:translocation and assembly module TamB
VKNVTVEADRTEAGRSRLRARIASAAFRENELGRLSIDAAGPDDNLVVGITADTAPGRTSLDATLAIRDGAVVVNVARGATLALPGGEWRLDKSTTVDVASDSVAVSPHCWRAHEGALCVDGIRWQGDRIDSKGQLTDLPIATIAWLDPALEGVRGSVEGDWRIERRGTAWRGAARLATVDFRYDPDMEQGDEVALPPVRATLALEADGGSMTLTIGAKASQMLIARARTRGYEADAPIEGSVDVTIEDLTRLATLSERAANTNGRITGSLAVTGTLRAPLLSGHVRLQDGTLEWHDPHLDLKQIELDLALAGDDAIRIEGTARSRDSDLRVKGAMTDVFAGTRRLHLSLTSDPVQVAMPDMELTVVPAIDLDWSNEATSLTGVARVPRARIKVSIARGSDSA